MDNLAVLILAAGLGKRVGSGRAKVLLKASGLTLLEHVAKACAPLLPTKIVVITGFGREEVEAVLKDTPDLPSSVKSQISFAFQKEQLGTGDAVRSAKDELAHFQGTVLVLYGDVPLVTPNTLQTFLDFHTRSNHTLSILSFHMPVTNSYGRIIRDLNTGEIKKISEAKDLGEGANQFEECNSGIYAVDSAFLFSAVARLKNENSQSEFYLTDIVEMACAEGQRVDALKFEDASEFLGVNTMSELVRVKGELYSRKLSELTAHGVEIEDAASVYIDSSVTVEKGAFIGPNVQLRGKTKIASGVKIEGTAVLIDTTVEEGATIKLGVRAEAAVIGKHASVGPFANLRPGTNLGDSVKIGNFVETKNTHMHSGAKASHLSYLGDAEVGKEANIGAGTITCNYDGVNKNKTKIGEGAFIGSNSSLVAPVAIGSGAYVGAGSVITKNVPDKALALTRAGLTVKENWKRR